MSLYSILNVSPIASKREIKTAYFELMKLYHPDKAHQLNPTTDKEMCMEKYHQIRFAYEILSDDIKRKDYDSTMTQSRSSNKMGTSFNIYNLIKDYFVQVRPDCAQHYNTLITSAYSGNENEFKDDCDNLNLKSIFTRILLSTPLLSNPTEFTSTLVSSSNLEQVDPLKIGKDEPKTYQLKVSLKDKYQNKLQYIEFSNSLNNATHIVVPSCVSSYTVRVNNEDINILVQVDNENDPSTIKQINDSDLLLTQSVSLSQYLYGGIIHIEWLDGETIQFKFDSCLEKKPVFALEQKGLPIPSQNLNKPILLRGTLYVYLTIEGVNSTISTELDQKYYSHIKELLNLMFPPIKFNH